MSMFITISVVGYVVMQHIITPWRMTGPTGNRPEGCPVVELPDAPEDLRHLLRVLVPSKTPLYWRNKGDLLPTLHSFSAIIRLSHKYYIENLQAQALAALKEHYCDTLDAYDARMTTHDQDDRRGLGESRIEIIESPTCPPFFRSHSTNVSPRDSSLGDGVGRTVRSSAQAPPVFNRSRRLCHRVLTAEHWSI
ncbi:hypothetical protein OH76DRAFT_1382245, partial [Lentinus brumalis]